MNKYLSLIFLYNRAGHRKILLIAAIIPLCFLTIFLLQIGNPAEASAYMMMENAFRGIWAVLLFVAVNVAALMTVANCLNGKKEVQSTVATTGYTIRMLRLSPIKSYLTIFIYYLGIILIFWGVAIASLYIIGKVGLTMAGASEGYTQFALGLLRTEIGNVLIPIANPTLMVFNAASVLTLASECAKSCYLSWHNGRPSFGAVLVIVPMALVWADVLEGTFVFVIIVIMIGYTVISFWDMISREKHPKGDPFKTNQYAGVMDVDGFEFDESVYAPQANTLIDDEDMDAMKASLPQIYGGEQEGKGKHLGSLNLFKLRRRLMPVGINLERANSLLGGCIFIGIGEHLVFIFKFILKLREISSSVKGMAILSGMKMPDFWVMEEHTYYGYILAILLAVFLQAYWNYEYYNKKTKSVYVMKMLPNRKEYMKTIWAAPIIQALFIVLIMAVHTVIDFCIYTIGTPGIAL